jgi:hypothetical protein
VPREFILRVVLADDFYEESITPSQELESWKNGDFNIEDLIGVAKDEPDCSVTYEVKDLA